MANPQREDGHIDIANEIAERLARINLSPYEWRILWVIWRKTWGWQKTEDWISLSQFCSLTGLKRSHACRTITKLFLRNVVTKKGNGINPIYSFQKDYDKWRPLPKKVILPKQVTQITRTGNKSLPKQGHTKEKQQKKLIQKTIQNKRVVFDVKQCRLLNVEAKIPIWKEKFPAVNIEQKLKEMEAWLDANPKRRKSNYERFIVNWLSKEQDRARISIEEDPKAWKKKI